MADIIKTWPAFMERDKVKRIFDLSEHERWRPDDRYYFVVSKNKPKQEVERIWFTHQGQVLGSFAVEKIVCNVGDNIPKLRSLENRESEWQIKRDRWVALCPGPFTWLEGEPVFHDSFRGFHYFNFEEYSQTMEAKIAL